MPYIGLKLFYVHVGTVGYCIYWHSLANLKSPKTCAHFYESPHTII
jgi:hypothetical protein